LLSILSCEIRVRLCVCCSLVCDRLSILSCEIRCRKCDHSTKIPRLSILSCEIREKQLDEAWETITRLSILSCEISHNSFNVVVEGDTGLSILSCEIRKRGDAKSKKHVHNPFNSLLRDQSNYVLTAQWTSGGVFQFSLARSDVDYANSYITNFVGLSILSCEIRNISLHAKPPLFPHTFNSLLRDQLSSRRHTCRPTFPTFNSLLRDQVMRFNCVRAK